MIYTVFEKMTFDEFIGSCLFFCILHLILIVPAMMAFQNSRPLLTKEKRDAFFSITAVFCFLFALCAALVFTGISPLGTGFLSGLTGILYGICIIFGFGFFYFFSAALLCFIWSKNMKVLPVVLYVTVFGVFSVFLFPPHQCPKAHRAVVHEYLTACQDAIIKYNTAHPDENCTSLQQLVPRYIETLEKDPWGNDYILNTEHGYICSAGPDGTFGSLDDQSAMDDNIFKFYKPQLMLAGGIFHDINNNGSADSGDTITLKFNKPGRRLDEKRKIIMPVITDFMLFDGACSQRWSDLEPAQEAAHFAEDWKIVSEDTAEILDQSGKKFPIYTVTIEMVYNDSDTLWIKHAFPDGILKLCANTTQNNIFYDNIPCTSIITPRNVPVIGFPIQ